MLEIEQIIALAAVHGVDLKHVAGAASNTEGVARRRQRTKLEVRLGLEVVETVTGRHSRTYRRPAWTFAELGQAAAGVPRIPWNAALYSHAGMRENYHDLLRALRREATRIAERERWPTYVRGETGAPQGYVEELAALVLDEDAHRPFFQAAPGLYAWCLHVAQPTWERNLEDRFRSVREVYLRWLSIAHGLIRRMILEGRVDNVAKAR